MENLRTDRSSLLVDQLDRAREIAQVRLTGFGDEEYLWEPAPGAWSIRRRGQASSPKAFGLGAWVLDRGASDIPAAEYAEIDRQVRRGMTPDKVAADWGVSTQRVEEILNRDRWHDSVAAMSPEQLDTPGFGQYPDGSDPDEPFATVLADQNLEFIHHMAEIALLRDLWRARSMSA